MAPFKSPTDEEITDASMLLQQHPGSLSAYRALLSQGARRLEQRFQQHEPIEELVRDRARLMDEILTSAWQHHLGSDAEAALIAVGGYGRAELHPASDIDLMILVGQDEPNLNEAISGLLTFCWDIGLEVGHSVRSVDECVAEASRDITIATNMMESRYLTGKRTLFNDMRSATGADRIWPSDSFFAAKLAEQQQRHRKYGDCAYNLEPNIKESPGGLRDIQIIGWVAKRHYGVETMFGLVEHGFLSEEEYGTLMNGQQWLWRIRFALHLLSGRREDRLLFDYQRSLATQFGFVDDDHNMAVEQFMQRYYRTIMELNRLNEILLQHFQEAILLHGEPVQPLPINRRFQACNGYLEAVDEQIFQREPYALLELFLLLAQHPELHGIRASTIRLLRKHRHLIDDHFRNDLRNRALFIEIMRQPQGITHALRHMNSYGLLAAYLPAFANIVGRMQYDLFHLFTVDQHTLFVVRNLRRFFVDKHHDEFPLCSDIAKRIPKPELLYLAGLFHDVAKGRGGDHSELGAEEITRFCHHHLLSEYDTRLTAWLVQNHLVMSMTAQRKDISDPEVIQAFAEQIATTNRLNHLYLLTVADSRATNPHRWTTWKDALLRELYSATYQALQRGLDKPQIQEELIHQKQAQALDELELRWGQPVSQVQALWQTLGNDYFLYNLPEEIVRQTAAILLTPSEQMPLVEVAESEERGSSAVFVFANEIRHLFAISTCLLDQLGLNIVEARIQTTSAGRTLHSFLVLEEDGRPIADLRREQEVTETLRNGILHPECVNLHATRRIARQLKHFETGTRIEYEQESNNPRTILRLVTGDRPGLLARIGLALADCRLRLLNAKIATIGEVAEDSFFLTNEQNRALNEKELECLRAALSKRLEE